MAEGWRIKLSAEQNGSQYPNLIGAQTTRYAPTDREGRITIAGYAPRYLAEHRLSDSGKTFYAGVINNYLNPRFASVGMVSITSSDVRQFLRDLETEHSGALLAKIRSVASLMWSDAIEAGIVSANPWRGQRTKPHVSRPRSSMTPDDFTQILACINPHYRLLVRTLGETGLRWSEAMRLVPDDIKAGVLHVRASKNGHARRVPGLAPDLADELRANLPFTNTLGRPLQYGAFPRWTWLPTVEGMANGPFDIHDLRAANATWLLSELGEGGLVKVRDRLGHSNISVTSRYLRASQCGGQGVGCS